MVKAGKLQGAARSKIVTAPEYREKALKLVGQVTGDSAWVR